MNTSSKVFMYSSDFCPFCRRAIRLLYTKGIEPEVRLVDDDPTARAEMMGRTGRHTVPQIFIGEEHVGGCDELYELEHDNRLDAMLTSANPGINVIELG